MIQLREKKNLLMQERKNNFRNDVLEKNEQAGNRAQSWRDWLCRGPGARLRRPQTSWGRSRGADGVGEGAVGVQCVDVGDVMRDSRMPEALSLEPGWSNTYPW